MKLINYNYGYNLIFSCSIHGKIVVSKKEWRDIQKYLFNPAVKLYYSYDKRMLKEDMARVIETKKGQLVNIRVYATERIVHRYHLKNYKRANYMFCIV